MQLWSGRTFEGIFNWAGAPWFDVHGLQGIAELANAVCKLQNRG